MRSSIESNRRMTFQYLKTVAVLLALVVPFPFIVNCGSSDYTDTAPVSMNAIVKFWFGGSAQGVSTAGKRHAEGKQVSVGLALVTTGSASQLDVSWTPPSGAANFAFPDLQPSNPGGPPPFLFTSVQAHDTQPAQPDITVQYDPPAVAGGYTLVNTVVATAADGTETGWSLSHVAGATGSTVVQHTYGKTAEAAVADETAHGWRWTVWLYDHAGSQDLSQDQAQGFIEYLQSGSFFIGLRFPVPQEADTLSYRLPPVMAPDDRPVIAILDHTLPWHDNELSQSVATVPLELSPSRQELFENELPEVPDTRWAAMTPKHDPIQLLDRFPLSAGDWELYTTGLLNLSNMPDSCQDCTVEVYLCHEGDEEPSFLSMLTSTAAGMATATGIGRVAYQGQGITCLGPMVERLTDPFGQTPPDPAFYFDGPGVGRVTPPAQATSLHVLNVAGSSAVTVNLATASQAGLTWSVYEGDYEKPDLAKPITGPVTIQGEKPIWLVADIPAETSGAENVTLTATSTADPSKSARTTTTLWIGEWQAPPGASWSGWVPVASHASGAHGSRWRTDLGLLNPGTAAADAEIRLHTSGGVLSMTRNVAAGSQLILADMVGQVPFSGSASVEVVAPHSLVVTSRSYSQVGSQATCYPNGTLGQNLDATAAGSGLSAGQSAWIPHLTETSDYRTNIGLVNTGDTEAQVKVHLLDGSGTELGSFTVTLPAGAWKQDNRPFHDRAGVSDLPTGYARIEVLSGAGIVAYGSVIDNLTNDPTTMPMVSSGGAAKTAWIPVASHASGAHGSRWRTDLGLLNPGTVATDAQIRLHTSGGVLSMTRNVAAGSQLILTDVVGQVPYSGSASVAILADRPLVVTSRSYSQVGSQADCYPNGTLGQNLDATPAGGGLSAGQSAWIPHLTETAGYRTNIGFVNTGAAEAQVKVHLLDGSGTELTSFTMTLPAGAWKQDNRPFSNRAGVSDLPAGYARIEVLSGAGIVAYGSVIDNLTNDPTTMPMVP